MATGFIYVVTTLKRGYVQKAFCNVPTEWGDRLYFGPCKKPMRPKMRPRDHVFGISPSSTPSRRIVFVAQIEERITFAEAYRRFPDLRGPEGPIHVRPIDGTGSFPTSDYQHISGSMHATNWQADLRTPDRDAFFVCVQRNTWRGRWLGPYGPEIDEEILAFLRRCSVHGHSKCLSTRNTDATLQNPIVYRRLYHGLHLETNEPEVLVEICDARMTSSTLNLDLERVVTPERRARTDSGALVGKLPVRYR
jgi:hypothetical protein